VVSQSGGCLDEDRVLALVAGSLDGPALAEATEHLDACARCRRLVAVMATSTTPAPSGQAAAPLVEGDVVARYRILGPVGIGGMGIVYAAHDPELDRKVAVKLLWRDASRGGARQDRILREAQSMARLSHPNVVRVYDVGVAGERIFVVMEFVEGTTLRRWLAEAPRSPREVVRVMLGAARGLAAAHQAGLIHRDFKPDNVLLGEGGRALVTDFGLAISPGRSDDAGEAREGERAPARTSAGAGTPAYMAPEQMTGDVVDARSDVFSYCATLYEALFGARPFPGETALAIREAVLRGPAPDPPAKRGVPQRIRRVVLQGLARDPARRPASMDEVIAALERDPSVTRRLVAGGVGIALLAAAGATAVVRAGSAPNAVCTGADQKLAEAWNPARKEAVRTALLASGKPWAAQTWQSVEETLDAYARGWITMRTEACEATRVTRVQSEALLDLRMSCLDARLAELRATADQLAKADAGALQSAVRAARSLSPLRACADTESLLAPVPMPAGAAARAEVDALRGEIAELRVLRQLGKIRDAEARAADVAKRARAVGYEPLLAEALFLWGTFLDWNGDPKRAQATLKEALMAAEGGRDRKQAAAVLAELVYQVGHEGGLPELGHDYARHAAAIVRALGGDAEIEGAIADNEGIVLGDEGRNADAERRHREAAGKFLAALGPGSIRYANALSNTAVAINAQDRQGDAVAAHAQAVEVYRAAVGEHHPAYAGALCNLADEQRELARLSEAHASAERALALMLETVGEEHTLVARAEHELGMIALDEGKPEEANRRFARALALGEKLRGPDHVYVANYALSRAEGLIAGHRPREAEPFCRRTAAIFAKAGNETEVARAEYVCGTALLEAGAPREALALLTHSLTVMEAHPDERRKLAFARFGMARALAATHGDEARARTLAEQAADTFAALGAVGQSDLVSVRAFLEGLGAKGR
jgi:tetratricopeptide (TPR) repeat protein